MYKITLNDRTVILTSTEQGDKLKEAQLQTNPPAYFEIDKNQYKLDKIAKVEYQPDEPITKALPEPSRCHGEKSIHLVIYEAYKKRLRDKGYTPYKEFSSKMYKWLYEKYPEREWCDTKKGTCFCEERNIVAQVQKIIPGATLIT